MSSSTSTQNQVKFFPSKLYHMLCEVDGLGLAHGASWVSEGQAFAVHNPDVFMKEIAPRFFDKQTHLRSFHRQLSIWGFTRLESGAGGRGVWFRKHFIRGKPENIKLIKRVPVKNPKAGTREIPTSRQRDYTNYQLPLTVQDYSSHQGDEAKARSNLPVVNIPPPPPPRPHVLYPPPNIHGPGYLVPVPVGGLNRPTVSEHAMQYPPFILTNYQPSAVASTNTKPTSLQTFISGGSAVGVAPPSNNGNNLGLNHMAQQLLVPRYEQHPPPPSAASYSSLLRGDTSSDINTTLLAMLLESRSREAPQFRSARTPNQLDQQLLAALAQRDLQRQAPVPREQAPLTTTTTSGQGLFTEEQLMAELARRNLDP